jgi:Carboxypeptidase regulatory-like domain
VKLMRLMALVLSIALTSASYPFVSVAAQAPIQVTGLNISGTVIRRDRTTVADACLRLRNVDTNAIVARTVSDRSGAFSFSVSEPGTYLVEAVDCGNGGVQAVSDALDLTRSPLGLKTVVVLPAEKEAILSSTALIVLAAASAAGITAFAIQSGASTPAVSSPEQ